MIALTNAEEQVMKYLWRLEKAFFKDLKSQYPDPKPATTTINTLLKRLIDKGYVGFRMYGNSREYYPVVEKNEYFGKQVKELIKDFFSNSTEQFASFFAQETDMDITALEELKEIVEKQIEKRKKNE